MKKTAILIAGLLPVLSACGAPAGATSDTAGAARGHATGKVVDTRGRPIAGAKILLDNTVFYASYINGSTRSDGSYRIRVQPGAWKAQASLEKEYNGQTYTLQLQPDNADAFDEEGAVRNFVWQLEGHIRGSNYGYAGGLIEVRPDPDFGHDMADVALTLTPSGPLIDGSTGKTLQLRVGDHYWVQDSQIEDVPIGRYLLRATLQSANGAVPLKVQDWNARGSFQPELQLDFKPSGITGGSAYIAIGN